MKKAKYLRGTLAEMLPAVLAYRNQPDHKPESMISNWSVLPANDNRTTAKSEGLEGEKLLKVTPSVEEIMRNTREDWVWDGDGRLVSIGRLRFSDGKQHHEPAYRRGEDGTIERYMRLMPKGSLLGGTETLTDGAGGQSVNITIGNATFCRRMGVPPRTFITSGRRRTGKSYSPAQSRQLIAEAIANTRALPPVVKCPTGVASGTAQYSDQFIGMKIGSTGKGGQIHWVDIYVSGLEHEAWMAAQRELSSEDREILDKATTAGSLAMLSPGGTARGARKRGRRLLLAANDNYRAAINKFAA